MFPCGVRIATRLCSSEHYARIRKIIYANATIKTIYIKNRKIQPYMVVFFLVVKKEN